MRALLLIILLLAAPCESRRRMRHTFEIEKVVKVPDYCKDYYQSTSAKWRPGFLEAELTENALKASEIGEPWYESEEYLKQQESIFQVIENRYSNHICKSEDFVPNVQFSTQELPCLEICHQCVPGSIPLCFLRNPFYAGLAQVCLCTYDILEPVEQAAFSIRHEKRIFSRRIRNPLDH